LAEAIFEPILFPYKYPNNFIPVILPAYTTYEDGTDKAIIVFNPAKLSAGHIYHQY
jgi:hypothetical protein